MLDKIPESLKSRKFWLAVGAFITFVASGAMTEALGVITAYIGLEGAADVVTRYQDGKKTQLEIETQAVDSDEADVDTIVSGDDL